MAATTAGALKTFLEAQGLNVSVFRDRPADQALPYISVQEAIVVTPNPDGDFGDTSASQTVTEQAQVDVWQQWRHPTTRAVTESYTLPDTVARKLHGAVLTAAPTLVNGCRVLSTVRLVEADENVVHHAVTVELSRVL